MTENQFISNLCVPNGMIDVVLDTDAFNEIDDQYAITYLIRSTEKCRVKGICAAPFFNHRSSSPADGMQRSYDEIIKILKLAKREDLIPNVFHGSEMFLKNETEPVISDSAQFIVDTAVSYSPEKPLYVVSIGAITNVASAILMAAEIAEKIVVVWLGGHAHDWQNTKEFNMAGDFAAARIVFGCKVPLVQLPCDGVVNRFAFNSEKLHSLLYGKNILADYLVDCTEKEALFCSCGSPNWQRVIWDVTAVAWLLNDGNRFMDFKITPSVMPEYSGVYSFPENSHPMCYVTNIHCTELQNDMAQKIGGISE